MPDVLTDLPSPATTEYVVHQFVDRADWLEGRRSLGIGSSDAAAILGVSRFKSPLALYYEKLGTTLPKPELEEARAWGLILEDPIATRYSAEVGRFVAKPPPHSVFVSTRHPFAIASIDRIINGVREGGAPPPAGLPPIGVLEIKNAHWFMADQWSADNNNEPPVEYQVQLQHQLMVTGAQWGSIAALIGGSRFVWADRARDEDLITVLAQREAEFWQRVLDRRPPDADGSEASREILRKIYPKDNGQVVALPPEAVEWHESLEAAKASEKAAHLDVETFSNKLRQAIGDATVGQLSNGVVYTYKLQSRAEFVTPASEFRVLRVKKPSR